MNRESLLRLSQPKMQGRGLATIFPSRRGRREKIRLAYEISFSRCSGDGKIHAAKIVGKGIIPNGLPAFREETQATWNKTI